jgi:hypothetical protein
MFFGVFVVFGFYGDGEGICGSLGKVRIHPFGRCDDRVGWIFANGQEFVKYAQNSHFACSVLLHPPIFEWLSILSCRPVFVNPPIWL